MVVQLLERDVPLEDTVDLPRPWAIYASDGEKWTPALIRSRVPGAEVTVEGGEVASAPRRWWRVTCCAAQPAGARVSFAGTATGSPTIPTLAPRSHDRARRRGRGRDRRVRSPGGELPGAVGLFGPASTYGPEGDTCPASWDDLGMTIEFANLGGLDPCGEEGRVAEARIERAEAAQAGWKTEEDATVEMPEDELQLYPTCGRRRRIRSTPRSRWGSCSRWSIAPRRSGSMSPLRRFLRGWRREGLSGS